MANLDELKKLFDGKSARGIGGCFSPAMGLGPSYLSNQLTNEISDVEKDGNDEEENSLADEDFTTPVSVPPKVSNRTQKRVREDTTTPDENKRRETSFDNVIKLLSNYGSTTNAPTKAQMVSSELIRMEVAEKNGDEYFVSAIKYLSEEKEANSFLALQNDNQKWIYLKGMEIANLNK